MNVTRAGFKVGCGGMGGRRNGWMGGQRDGRMDGRGVGGWMGLRVGFININDMYNNDGEKGGARGCEAHEAT